MQSLQESSDNHPYTDSLSFLNFSEYCKRSIWQFDTNVINQNLGVYPISLLSDLCNIDYAVKIAVLTPKYQYVQHKYTK